MPSPKGSMPAAFIGIVRDGPVFPRHDGRGTGKNQINRENHIYSVFADV